MSGQRSNLRASALLVLGALAVHQLRYLAAFGSDGGEVLHREGHTYLAQALPILVAFATAAVAISVIRGALSTSRASAGGSWWSRGLWFAAAIGAVFAAQELAEGALAAGHPAGLGALVGGGAWIAFPIALVLGLATALVERVLEGAELLIAARVAPSSASLAPSAASRLPASHARPPLAARPLAFGLARRPPPGPALI